MKRKRSLSRRRNRGFTLMEVLLVVAILLILAGLATVAITKTYKGARVNAAKLDITTITQTLDAYYLDIGTYPPSLDALVAMPEGINQAKWNGPYLTKGLPADPWGGKYDYSVNNDQPYVRSAGPDGAFDTDDDVDNS